MKKISAFFISSPPATYTLVGFILIFSLYKIKPITSENLIPEIYGMILDLVVIGTLLSIYDKIREKRENISRCEDEINDFRKWQSEEAKCRIVGNLRRLKKLNVQKINLSNCYLPNVDFREFNSLQDIDFSNCNLENSTLIKLNLNNINFQKANLRDANLVESTFDGADLRGANLVDAYIISKDLKANFLGAKLDNAMINEEQIEEFKSCGADITKMQILYNLE